MATALLLGFCQVLNPAITFLRDMQPHSLGMNRNWFVPLVITVASILLYVEALYPQAYRQADILLQQHLPFKFRLKLVVQNHIGIVVLTIGMVILRRFTQRELEVTREASAQSNSEAAVTIGVASRHDSIIDGGALRRHSESADVSPWLRHTQSSMGDMAALLPKKL